MDNTTTLCDVAAEQKALREHYAAVFANDSEVTDSQHGSIGSVVTGMERFTAFLCFFGLVGNILNVVVLSRKGSAVSMERMERAAHCSLLALAVSDLCFCLLMLLHTWMPESNEYLHRSFALYFSMYSDGLINTFLLTSTWLTVTMAMSRYLAICYPLRARQFIGMTFARASIILVFVACVLLNIPKYFTWRLSVDAVSYCAPVFYLENGALLQGRGAEQAYRWAYFSWAIFIPFVALAYCNLNLIRALRRSFRIRSSLQAGRTPSNIHLSNRITLIFVVIIILYLLTVIPGELLHFSRDTASRSLDGHLAFNLAIAFTNALQTLNFSSNFVLYSALNTQFRRQLCMLVRCQRRSRHRHSSSITASTRQVELSISEHALTTSFVQQNRSYV
ncbi:hypothetical protein CAPTEDRAFT_227407 [Capitella teleta]|uniref:G-protein coupled receptors family 1 profile domain-containing protein n=1 Tax=Capitella teleta TaxID=283909 RepID=R7URF8_CAPTE|nr:hypothetical protein CAPTEDRAFT_227407 [Capitella teleta]|eukprot:ELU08718.1 hypothetical protein CAPTEDRAFT_227407 [Capitella teleta]